MTNLPLTSPIITNSYDKIAINANGFKKKSSLVWNNAIQNIHTKNGNGIVTTRGDILNLGQTDKGIQITNEKGHSKKINFNWVMDNKYNIPKVESGDCVASMLHDGKIYSLWENTVNKQSEFALHTFDILEDNTLSESGSNILYYDTDILATSAMLCPSNYKENKTPLLAVVYVDTTNPFTSTNKIKVYEVTDLTSPIIDWVMPNDGQYRYVPLGKCSSGLRRQTNIGNVVSETVILAFEDIDHNRCRGIMFKERVGQWDITQYPFIGYVSPEGVMTGEPYPTNSVGTRQSNGVYVWDTYTTQDETGVPQAYNIVAGYYFNQDDTMSTIIVESVSDTEWWQGNISVNNKAMADDVVLGNLDPKRYIVTNYAESKSVYYDYGKGWVRTYSRKCSRTETGTAPKVGTVITLDIYTFGCKNINQQRWRKESFIPGSGNAGYAGIPYNDGLLNQRVYWAGYTHVGTYSCLNSIPWNVEVFQNDTAVNNDTRDDYLNVQMYAGAPISLSYNRSLLTNGNENLGNWDCQVDTLDMSSMERMTVSNGQNIFTVKWSHALEDIKVSKIADYMFGLNIIDGDNIIYDDESFTLGRYAIPYHGDAIIDIAGYNFSSPAATSTASSGTWLEGIGYNALLLTSESRSTSYLFPPVSIYMSVATTDMAQYKKGIDNKGSILKPLLAGCFADYEYVDRFYTDTSISTNVVYRTTNIIKAKYVTSDDDTTMAGKATYDIAKEGTSYVFSSQAGIFMPLGLGSTFYSVNNYSPSVQLNANYVGYLYRQNNITLTSFNFLTKLKNAQALFTIFGQSYYYDGRNIVNVGSEQSFDKAQFVLYALGLRYVGNSANEAWFYSDFERRLFVFSGSNTLTQGEILSNMGDLRESFYNTKDQCLYMLFDDGLYMKTAQDSAFIPDTDIKALYSCDLGVSLELQGKDVEVLSLYEKPSFLGHREFLLQTAELGGNEGLAQCSSIDIVLYNLGQEKMSVDIEVASVSGIDVVNDRKTFVVGKNDWRGSQYRIRVSPSRNIANGFSVKIRSDDMVCVSSILFDVKPVSQKQGAVNHFI